MLIRSLDQLVQRGDERITLLDAFLKTHNLTDLVRADHIGYKCASTESYEHIRSLFEADCRYIHQSIISKRRISIVALSVPFQTSAGEVGYLELSDQKPDGSQVEGFDHIEVYPVGVSEIELVETLRGNSVEVIEDKKPHHQTHKIEIAHDFTLKIESEPLIEKIIRDEMK